MNMIYHCWCWPWPLVLSSTLLFSILYSLKEATMRMLHLFEDKTSTLIIGNFSVRETISSLSFIQSFICISMDSWNFRLWYYNLVLLYSLVAQIIPPLAIGSSFSWLLCIPLQYEDLFLSSSYFLVLKDVPNLSYVFAAPDWKSASISKELWFLLLENGIRN